MNSIFSGLLFPAIFWGLAYIAYRVLLVGKDGLPWHKKRKAPFTTNFLRPPGYSVFEKVEGLRFDVIGHMLGVAILPILLIATYLVMEKLSDKPMTVLAKGIMLSAALGLMLHQMIKLYRGARELKMMRLGYEAEVAVGQELNQLMRAGFYVFHDLPADKFNIDHVVIGPTGVFAVETKGRSKPVTGDGKADARVIIEGDVLHFPHWKERQPVQQARRQAKWLSGWLTRAVGEQVPVTPVLTLPGWYTEIKQPTDVKIFYGRKPEKLFAIPHSKPPLSDVMIKRIVHQIDAKCRDVEPKSYAPPISKMAKSAS